MYGYKNNYFNTDLIGSIKKAMNASLSEANTTSGRESGIGPGKTLMQTDKTWDEVARETSADWAKRSGKDINKVKFERKDGKVYADGVEMTTASMKTSQYAKDAKTRAELTAGAAPKTDKLAIVNAQRADVNLDPLLPSDERFGSQEGRDAMAREYQDRVASMYRTPEKPTGKAAVEAGTTVSPAAGRAPAATGAVEKPMPRNLVPASSGTSTPRRDVTQPLTFTPPDLSAPKTPEIAKPAKEVATVGNAVSIPTTPPKVPSFVTDVERATRKVSTPADKPRVMTTSGRPTGVGPGKTLVQPDKTWDEVAGAEQTPTDIKLPGPLGMVGGMANMASAARNEKIANVQRGRGVVTRDGVVDTTATTRTSQYGENAPTRRELQTQLPTGLMDVLNARLSRRGIYDASRGKAKIGTSPVTPTGTPIAQRAAPAGATPVDLPTKSQKEQGSSLFGGYDLAPHHGSKSKK